MAYSRNDVNFRDFYTLKASLCLYETGNLFPGYQSGIQQDTRRYPYNDSQSRQEWGLLFPEQSDRRRESCELSDRSMFWS